MFYTEVYERGRPFSGIMRGGEQDLVLRGKQSSMSMNTRSVQRALNSILTGTGRVPRVLSDEREPEMRVGREYQAVVPNLETGPSDVAGVTPGSVLVWVPTERLSEEDLDAYLQIAKEQFGYGTEQALGLLLWHKYNIDKALEDLPNFCPLRDEWTMEDTVTFEQAFHHHGKNFQRIRAMLPDKPISSLVKHYYLWKRSYDQYSLMDKRTRRNSKRICAGLPPMNDDSDSNNSSSSHSEGGGPPPPPPIFGKGKQLPKGIHLSPAELTQLCNDTSGLYLKQLEREAQDLKDKIQKNKQLLAELKEKSCGLEGIEQLRPMDFTKKVGAPSRWTEEEIHIALEVIHEHGKDFEAMATALESKTVAQCRNFFTNYKRKLNLPRIIAEYEIRHGQKHSRYSKHAREVETVPGHKEKNSNIGGSYEAMPPDSVPVRATVSVDSGPQAKRPRLTNSSITMDTVRNI